MLRATRILTVLIAAAALSGCSTMKIHTDYDPGRDFSRLQSYAWLPSPPQRTGDPRIDNSLLNARIRTAVDAQVAERGYRMTSPEEADFLISYHAGLENKLDVNTIHSSYGYGRGRWYGGGGSETIVREYEQGTLLLDFLDPKTRELMWRGSASDRIKRKDSPEESQKRVNEAVAAILKRFPPQ
jgi:hypothetical protein